MKVFRSRSHPGDAPLGLVYARALVGPLAWSMTSVMIAATAAILEEQDPLPWVLWVVPLVYALATAWTVYTLRHTPAEIVFEGSHAGVRSVWDAARTSALRLDPVHPPRRTMQGLDVPVGRTLYSFAPDEWPGFEQLEKTAFEAARGTEEARAARTKR